MACGRSAGSNHLSFEPGSVNADARSDVVGSVPGLILPVDNESEFMKVHATLTKRQRKRKRDSDRKKQHIVKAKKLKEAMEMKENETKGIKEELMCMKAHKGLLERRVYMCTCTDLNIRLHVHVFKVRVA